MLRKVRMFVNKLYCVSKLYSAQQITAKTHRNTICTKTIKLQFNISLHMKCKRVKCNTTCHDLMSRPPCARTVPLQRQRTCTDRLPHCVCTTRQRTIATTHAATEAAARDAVDDTVDDTDEWNVGHRTDWQWRRFFRVPGPGVMTPYDPLTFWRWGGVKMRTDLPTLNIYVEFIGLFRTLFDCINCIKMLGSGLSG